MKASRRRLVVGLAGLIAGSAVASDASTDFPSRPLKIVVPFSPGASNDTVARLLAPHMAEYLKQPVTVENRPGAGGDIGMAYAAKSKPDGYTLLLTSNAATVSTATKKRPAVDLMKDLTPLALVGTQPMLLVAAPTLGVDNVQQLLASAKAAPEKYSFGTPGAATPHHLTFELVNVARGIKMIHVPFPGAAQALTEVVAGRVSVTLATKVSAGPFLSSGRVKVLGAVARERLKEFPEVPTLVETGFGGLESGFWYGVTMPAGASPAVLDKLTRALAASLAQPAVQEQLRKMDIDASTLSGAEFGRFIDTDFRKWKNVAEKAGIDVD